MPEVTSPPGNLVTPKPPINPVPEPPPRRSWGEIRERARSYGRLAVLFGFLLLLGGAAGWFYSRVHQPVPSSSSGQKVTNLSANDLSKLGQVGTSLGETGQTLNIAADALFRGKVTVAGDISVSGHLNANGPVTLSALTLNSATGTTGLNVGSNAVVGGNATVGQNLTVGGLISGAGLNVSGNASLNAINANSLAVRSLSISGPLTIGHLVTSGPTPGIVAGNVGAGGTVSISGNDTAGTININTGVGPSGTLASITFRAAFGASVHVLLTPLTGDAAGSGAFVTRTSGGFQVHANTPPSGRTLSFDYVVMQ